MVVLNHTRGCYFVKWDDLNNKNLFDWMAFGASKMGREAVMVFFVLSGYLVGGNAIRQFFDGEFRFQKYAVARLTRLYMVLFPALLLTWYCDTLHLKMAPEFGVNVHLDFFTFLKNLGFLQGICSPNYGSNGPLWSLAYEFWYYCLLGIALSGLARPFGLKTIMAILAAGLTLIIMPHECLVLLSIWCAGAAANFTRIQLNYFGGIIAFVIFCGSVAGNVLAPGLLTETLVGLTFVPVLIWLTRLPFPNSIIFKWLGHRLAGFSYTLYANHYPITGLVMTALVPIRLQTGFKQWLGYVGILSLIIIVNYGLYWCFERRTDVVRKYIMAQWEIPNRKKNQHQSDASIF